MDGSITIETNVDTKLFDRQIKYIEEKMLDIEYQLEQADKGFEVGDTLKLEAEYEKLNNQLLGLLQKRNELEDVGKLNIKEHISSIGKSLKDIIVKVGKWGLALLSVRGAYSFIRQSMSTLASTDDGMATKLEYIRWALATTIKPVVEWIINAMYKILSIFGGIIKAITGYNIFANASVKSFEKMKKSSGTIKKNTNAIKKALYGWDELTRVEESNGVTGGGLSKGVQDAIDKMPKLNTEVDNVGQKIKRWFLGGDTLEEGLKNIIPTLNTYVEGIKTKIITPFANWLKKEFEPAKKILKPIYDYTKENVIEPLKKEFDNFKEYIKPITDWISQNILTPTKKKFNEFKTEFLNMFAPFINKIIDWINQTFAVFGVHIKHVGTDTKKETDIAGKAFNNFKDVATNVAEKVDKKVDNTGKNIKEEVSGNLKDAKEKANDLSGQTYKVNIENGQIIEAKSGIQGVLDGLKNLTSKTWNILTKVTTSGKTLKSWYNDTLRNTFSKVGIDLPKLAKGGIINMPGRGIPLATGGEKGAEGVIPLTDSQQMALLGEAIGKYITVNASITNTMNGRIISRELQKIQNESNFANNR